ncbi:MAG: ribosomal protein S18-alanine N-acetyltransferase [Gemmatimonadaceae bacterium]|nr:ribosomal protein S18-alanine N-acetyltransferase [Gemmatimonadaceae bacterium]
MNGDLPDAFTVRPATLADLPAILSIERIAFSDPWTADAFRSMLGQDHVLTTVAERDGRLVGYSVAWAVGDEAELANLAVAPEHRGTGVAKRLLDHLLDDLDARGGATIYLEVRDSNAPAQGLYRSRGFTAAGRRKGYYRKPTEDAVVMRRPRAVDLGDD